MDELGRRADIGPSTLSRLETGQRRITIDDPPARRYRRPISAPTEHGPRGRTTYVRGPHPT